MNHQSIRSSPLRFVRFTLPGVAFCRRLKSFWGRPVFHGRRVKVLLLRLWWEFQCRIVRGPLSAKLDHQTRLGLLPVPACFPIYALGSSEPEVSGLLLAHLRPGMTFFDVGAYIGEHSVRAAQIVGKEGCVCAFEPNPTAFHMLNRNIRSGGLTNVFHEQLALSDTSGETVFEQRRYPDGSGLLRRTVNAEFDRTNPMLTTRSVRSMRLDEYVRQANLAKVDLVKLDVEGVELKVLRGADSLLGRFSPKLIFELDTQLMATYGFHPREILAFLRDRGYRVFLARIEHNELVLEEFSLPASGEVHATLTAFRDKDSPLPASLAGP